MQPLTDCRKVGIEICEHFRFCSVAEHFIADGLRAVAPDQKTPDADNSASALCSRSTVDKNGLAIPDCAIDRPDGSDIVFDSASSVSSKRKPLVTNAESFGCRQFGLRVFVMRLSTGQVDNDLDAMLPQCWLDHPFRDLAAAIDLPVSDRTKAFCGEAVFEDTFPQTDAAADNQRCNEYCFPATKQGQARLRKSHVAIHCGEEQVGWVSDPTLFSQLFGRDGVSTYGCQMMS